MHVVNAAVLEKWIELSDKQVVADVLAGHTALFELLMRRHNERVYRAARAIVRDEAEAEDVMQQSYVHAYAHPAVQRPGAIFDVVDTNSDQRISGARPRQAAVRTVRQEQSNIKMLMNMRPPALMGRRRIGRVFASPRVAIDRLPNGAREVFVLREVEGMSARRSAQPGQSEDVVEHALARALAALRRDLTSGRVLRLLMHSGLSTELQSSWRQSAVGGSQSLPVSAPALAE